MLKHLLISAVLLTLGCISTGSRKETHEKPEDDTGYHSAYTKASRYAEVVDNFEAKFAVTATWLSEDFLSALANRIRQLFDEDQPVLSQKSSDTSFFISLNTPIDAMARLSNERLWAISAEEGGQRFKPKTVRRIEEKLRWRAFYPKVNEWSHEYLIVFEQPLTAPKLIMASPEAKVQLIW